MPRFRRSSAPGSASRTGWSGCRSGSRMSRICGRTSRRRWPPSEWGIQQGYPRGVSKGKTVNNCLTLALTRRARVDCHDRQNPKSQNPKRSCTMAVGLGDVAPDFTQESTEGPIHFHEWIGNGWAVLFSHPKDFTPVCTTELGEVARLKPEFDKRNVKVIGLSVDDLESHQGWVGDIAETQGHALNYPLIADADRSVSLAYGMIHPNASDSFTVRSVYVIDPNRKVRLIITYPASTGRNFEEILRVIDSLQLTDTH